MNKIIPIIGVIFLIAVVAVLLIPTLDNTSSPNTSIPSPDNGIGPSYSSPENNDIAISEYCDETYGVCITPPSGWITSGDLEPGVTAKWGSLFGDVMRIKPYFFVAPPGATAADFGEQEKNTLVSGFISGQTDFELDYLEHKIINGMDVLEMRYSTNTHNIPTKHIDILYVVNGDLLRFTYASPQNIAGEPHHINMLGYIEESINSLKPN
jgi:hypothetical protein